MEKDTTGNLWGIGTPRDTLNGSKGKPISRAHVGGHFYPTSHAVLFHSMEKSLRTFNKREVSEDSSRSEEVYLPSCTSP